MRINNAAQSGNVPLTNYSESAAPSKTKSPPQPWLASAGNQTRAKQSVSPPTGGGLSRSRVLKNLLEILTRMMQLFLMLITNKVASNSGKHKPVAASADGVRETTSNKGAGGGGARIDGPDGFLFKPVSDSNGKLVVLTPEALTGKIEGVVIRGPDGRVIEEGRYASVANGGREHFRFNKAGGDYPANLTVEVKLKDGSTKTFQIADPSQRND